MPLISIILPTYNVEKYISRALESCINQTLKDIEIIVVDDKGQDRSIEIAKEYASRDNRIRIVHNEENLKLLHARAEGVKVATSELIMFLDPDDELELNACEIAYNNFDKNYDVLRFRYSLIGFDDNFKLNHPKNYEDFEKRVKNLEYFDFLMWDMLIKKDLYLRCLEFIYKYKLIQINIAEDIAFNFLIINFSNGYKQIDDKLYKYYQNNSSMTNQKSQDRYKIFIETKSKILDFFNNIYKQQSDIIKKEIYYSFYFAVCLSIVHDKKEFNKNYIVGIKKTLNKLKLSLEKKKIKFYKKIKRLI